MSAHSKFLSLQWIIHRRQTTQFGNRVVICVTPIFINHTKYAQQANRLFEFNVHRARRSHWFQLLQYAAGDLIRLREIQRARGYKPAWVRYAVADAAGRGGAA